MSRVCPGCPQTSPREAREASCILDAYGEHRTSNLKPRTSNIRRPGKATRTPDKARYMRGTSQVKARYMRGACVEHAWYKPPRGHQKAVTVSGCFHWPGKGACGSLAQ